MAFHPDLFCTMMKNHILKYHIFQQYYHMSHDYEIMRFKQCGSLTSLDSDNPMQFPIKPIETPNAVQSVA